MKNNRTLSFMLPFLLPALAACGGAKQAGDTKTASDEDSNEVASDKKGDMPEEKTASVPSSDKPAPGSQDDSAGPKKDECSIFETANLEQVLLKSSCEVPSPKPDDKPMEAKNVEVKVATSSAKIAPS